MNILCGHCKESLGLLGNPFFLVIILLRHVQRLLFFFFSFPILCYWKFVEFSPTKTAELFKFTIGEKIPFFIENNNKNCQKKALVMMNLLCFQTLFKIWIVVLGAWDLGDMGL